ncbi:methyl-accepting chemotaxis protein [Desulfobacter sp.]
MKKKYKIRHKISFGFAVTLGCALLIGGSALYTLYMMKERVKTQNAIDHMVTTGIQARQAAGKWLVDRESLARQEKEDAREEQDKQDYIDPLKLYARLKQEMETKAVNLQSSGISRDDQESLERILQSFRDYDRAFVDFQKQFFTGVVLMDRLREQSVRIMGKTLSLGKAVNRRTKKLNKKLSGLKKNVNNGAEATAEDFKVLLEIQGQMEEISKSKSLAGLLANKPLAFQEMAKDFVLYQDDKSGSGLILEMEKLLGINKEAGMGASLPMMKSSFSTGREAKLFAGISEATHTYLNTFKEYYQLNFAMRKSMKHMDNESRNLETVIEQACEGQMKRFDAYQRNAALFLLGLLVLCLVAGILAGIRISRNIVPPIEFLAELADRFSTGNVSVDKGRQEILSGIQGRSDELGHTARSFARMANHFSEKSAVASKISEGDLEVRVDKASDEDIMGKAFEKIVDRLGALLGEIKLSARKVKQDTDQINQANQDLSKWNGEQALSIQSLREKVDAVSAKTRENAGSAEHADTLARNSANLAEAGKSEMATMVKAMSDIDRSSRAVSSVVKVIRDIADQTRRLALNATIEAARAGEKGKGFAVVAQEIRNLATQSTESVQESTRLVEETLEKVSYGNRSVGKAVESLDRITEVINKINREMEQIKTSSHFQISEIENILSELRDVEAVVQNTAAGAEETAQISGFLNDQAIRLEQSMDMFKVRDEDDL